MFEAHLGGFPSAAGVLSEAQEHAT